MRLRSAWFAFALLASAGHAQFGTSFGSVAPIAKKLNLRTAGVTQSPTQPTGFPGLPPKDDRLPPPQPVDAETARFQILHAGKTSRLGQRVTASGGVHASYQGYDLLADEMEGNLDTDIFELRGNVSVIGVDSIVVGERVWLNMKDRTFRADAADVQLRPSFLEGRVVDDLYLRSAETSGSRREMFGDGSAMTSCNLDHPHFEIESADTVVRPGKRMILRNTRIKIQGRTIFGLPYLSIPLDRRDDRYTPEVGQSPDEGYFVKFRYPVALDRKNVIDANLDYYTKLGNGFGGRFEYEGASAEGMLRAYGIIGRTRTFEFQGQHLQKLGTSTLNLTTNLQRQNYVNAPENTFWDTRVFLRVPQKTGATSLGYSRSSNESPEFRYIQQMFTFSDQRRPTPRTTTSLDFGFSSSSTDIGGTSVFQREQADVRFRGQHDLQRAMAELEYQRAIPVGETTNFFSSADRTPVLTLRSDARRLFGGKAATTLPFQTELSIGEFGNPGTNDRITRTLFDFSFSRPDTSSGRLGASFDGRYRQGLYSDDTAQYQLSGGTHVRYRLGRDTGLNLRYYYLRPYGFTPLSQDRGGRSNLVTSDLSLRVIRSLKLGLQTGYDFLLEQQGQVSWQTVSLRSEWTPASWFSIRGLSTYDPFQQAWSNVRLDLAWRAGATFISAGARYDGFRHTWGNLNLFIDGLKYGRLKASTILAYNGYLKQFEARHFSFTYDLHCAEVIFQIIDNPVGFRPGTQYFLFLRLKALPFSTPFGSGQRGQPIGTGTGDGF